MNLFPADASPLQLYGILVFAVMGVICAAILLFAFVRKMVERRRARRQAAEQPQSECAPSPQSTKQPKEDE